MFPCRRLAPSITRREWLQRSACGFGAVALSALLPQSRSVLAAETRGNPYEPKPSHFKPSSRNVIFLYMDGGPSQVDTWDPKPRLQEEHGQPFKMKIEQTQFNKQRQYARQPMEIPPLWRERYARQ